MRKTIITQMIPREKRDWIPPQRISSKLNHRRNRYSAAIASVCLCLGLGVVSIFTQPESRAIMSHLTAGFEYDGSLGRLQYVSNILPESAMVFLNSNASSMQPVMPLQTTLSHTWTQSEPWLEYSGAGKVSACSDGEVMTIIKNHENKYTVRVLHDSGYESIYSGLSCVMLSEHDSVHAGQQIGTSDGHTAFELRKDSLSVQPVFSEI